MSAAGHLPAAPAFEDEQVLAKPDSPVQRFLDSPTVRAATLRTLEGCGTNAEYLTDALLREYRELT